MNAIITCLFNLLLLLVFPGNFDKGDNSKEPKKIVSIAQEFYELDYYISQAELWKVEIDKDQSNADAWLNYYRASRIVNMIGGSEVQQDLNNIYKELANHIDGTYEYHYLSYVNGMMADTLFHHIEKAYELDSDRTEIYSLMINRAVINQDYEGMKEFNSKWMNSGEISQGILAWNYNSLMSLEPNAILLTYGDNDTYPAWMLQQVQELRTDVEVINVNLLRKRNYCDAAFSKCGIPTLIDEVEQGIIWQEDFIPVADHILRHAVRPVYFNVTVPKTIREHYKDKLYTVGLSFKYSNEPFDNIRVLKENYENKFLTDYILLGFQNDKSVSVLNSLNMTYLPAFLSLIKEYNQEEQNAKRERLSIIVNNIAKAGGKLLDVEAIMDSSKKLKPLTETLINIKSIDKQIKSIGNGLYASDIETSNENYEQFLMDLLRNKEFELLEICKMGKTDWMSLMPEEHKDLDQMTVFVHGGPDQPMCPIQNISYEAANLYCEWLTRAYNGYDKKKNFEEVIFRLPTEAEWELAAKGGRGDAAYPWGGYYYRNAKGCYLSNFFSSHEPMCTDCANRFPDNDGAFFPVKGDTYFPNDFGLYCMSGNVAEMVQEKGIAKGGSWEDIPQDCTIGSVKQVDGPSPAVGFRVFMEVIK